MTCRRWIALAVALALSSAFTGCECNARRQPDAGQSTGRVPASQLDLLWKAELHRNIDAFTPQVLGSRSKETRRAAARALSRTGGDIAYKRLAPMLADPDPTVVSWTALGLSKQCPKREHEIVNRLVTTAARLFVHEQDAAYQPTIRALTDALARCGTTKAERTLAAWLKAPSPVAEAAALGLGQLAAHRRRLDDESLAVLLSLAEQDPPLDSALYPFARLTRLSVSLKSRLLAAAQRGLAADGLRREYALRALPSAGAEAVALLEAFALKTEATLGQRALAVRGLAKLGSAADSALQRVLLKIVKGGAATRLDREYLLLASTLTALPKEVTIARPVLESLARLAVEESEPLVVHRRKVELRCAAAARVANGPWLSPLVSDCDPDRGRPQLLAELKVLDRRRLVGDRRRRYLELLAAPDPIVAEGALSLAPAHAELGSLGAIFESALASRQSGTITTALQLLALYPDRTQPSGSPDTTPTLVQLKNQVLAVLKRGEQVSPEQRIAAFAAGASLQMQEAKPALEAACVHPNRTLREHAERALRLLGDRGRECPNWVRVTKLAEAPLMPRKTRLRFFTDVGELSLTLDPKFAPLAVARVLRLAKEGFYNDMPVHRVVPGFVVQFGDRDGDGFAQAEPKPIGTEYSPDEFGKLSVGMALAGPDTGAAQLFVTLGTYPRLRGDYAWLGRAEGGWEMLAEGDRIQRVTVQELGPAKALSH